MFLMRLRRLSPLLFLIAFFINAPGINAQAEENNLRSVLERSFQNGLFPAANYSGAMDTVIKQQAEDNNFGRQSYIDVDGDDPQNSGLKNWGILKWDLSSIPAGSKVLSAAITIYITDPGHSYEIYEMKKNWSELGATWKTYDGNNDWETAGAQGQTDRGYTMLGVTPESVINAQNVVFNQPGINLAQSWVDNPSGNYGVIIGDPDHTNGMDFASSDAENAQNRPKLTITYIPPSPSLVSFPPSRNKIILISDYANGKPPVPPKEIPKGSTDQCVGTFRFAGSGTVTAMTITAYGNVDARTDLVNVRLYKDNGDGNWKPQKDIVQLGAATNFNSNKMASFYGFSLSAGDDTYVHVVLDVSTSAASGTDLGVEFFRAEDIVSADTVSAKSWPVQSGQSAVTLIVKTIESYIMIILYCLICAAAMLYTFNCAFKKN